MIGEKIGRYTIIEQLGSGEMSTIYRAEDKDQAQTVVLQLMQPGMRIADDVTPNVITLNHPHIVRVYEYGTTDFGQFYLVTQFAGGGDLSQLLKRGAPPFATTIKIVKQIAEALDYAHNQDVLHLDVKPTNILLDESDNVLLNGFELLSHKSSSVRHDITESNFVVGSPNYMSPEKATAEGIRSSDIYSLGVIAFEMITGQTPYHAMTPMAVMMKMMKDPVPSVGEFRNNLSPIDGLDDIFQTVLAKEPAKRYPTAIQFAEALDHALQSVTIDASVPASQSTSNIKRKVFISYRKLDKDIVHPMKQVIENWNNIDAVWMDTHLEGGQHWWDTILREIREADLIITALSNDYLDSIPCQREYTYALDLNKTLLPVRVGELDYNRVAKALVQIQMIDFFTNSQSEQTALYNAIQNAPMSPELPSPLPEPPAVPLSVLVEVEELANKTTISRDDEDKIFVRLFELMNGDNDADRASAGEIIEKLKARQDITRGFYEKLATFSQLKSKKGIFDFWKNRRKR